MASDHNSATTSPRHGDTHGQEFLHNSREILNQIFKARMTAPHTVSAQETISHLDAMKSKALLANFFSSKAAGTRPNSWPSETSPTASGEPTQEVSPRSPQQSTKASCEELDDETAGYIAEEVNNIWGKLRDCAMGLKSLDPDDAAEVLLLLSSLVNTDMQKSHEEIAESIFSTIDKDDLKTIDEDFLRYLTSHYAKLITQDDVAPADAFNEQQVEEAHVRSL
jgi:hypothetical protein